MDIFRVPVIVYMCLGVFVSAHVSACVCVCVWLGMVNDSHLLSCVLRKLKNRAVNTFR